MAEVQTRRVAATYVESGTDEGGHPYYQITGYTVYTNGDALCVRADHKSFVDYDGSHRDFTDYSASGLTRREAKILFKACERRAFIDGFGAG